MIEVDYEMMSDIERIIERQLNKGLKQFLLKDTGFSIEVDKRGRLQIGLWRDQLDWHKPIVKVNIVDLLLEELGYVSEEDNWTFDPYRKALKRLLAVVDKKEKECIKKYEEEHEKETENR
jgi:hypothetical protein